MKKLAIAVLTVATMGSASAGFFDNNNFTPWGNNLNNGYAEDNGIFSYNPYSYFNPRWYIKEANNFMNEIDEGGEYQPKSNHNFPAQYENGNQVTYGYKYK